MKLFSAPLIVLIGSAIALPQAPSQDQTAKAMLEKFKGLHIFCTDYIDQNLVDCQVENKPGSENFSKICDGKPGGCQSCVEDKYIAKQPGRDFEFSCEYIPEAAQSVQSQETQQPKETREQLQQQLAERLRTVCVGGGMDQDTCKFRLYDCIAKLTPSGTTSPDELARCVGANQQPKPAPVSPSGGSPLKPFKEPASDPHNDIKRCGVITVEHAARWRSEDCAGTEKFCNEAFYKYTEETFASPEECLASRQPKPATDEQNACDCSKPYTAKDSLPDECFDGYEDKEAALLGLRIIENCTQIGCSIEEYKAECGCDGYESLCRPI